MIELLYGLYREQSISEVIYTLIASSIINGFGSIRNNKVHVDGSYYPGYIGKFLSRIKVNKKNNVSWQDIFEIKKYFTQELIKLGYISRFPLIGGFRNIKFYKYVFKNKNLVDERIKLYIDKNDIEYLSDIDINIIKISFSFPESNAFNSFYENNTDMMKSFSDAKHCNIDARRYSSYYSMSGKKIKIK